jgi:serine protease Do
MDDPLRSKLKVVLYTSLALVLGLGLASGFKSVRGGEAATLPDGPVSAELDAAPATEAATETATAVADESPATPALVPGDFQALAEVSRALVAITEQVKPAVVSVVSSGTINARQLPRGFEDLFGQPFHDQQPESFFDAPLGRGSGFIVSKDGYILTNNHVVRNAERIDVELSDGRAFLAELVGRDPTTDIALLKIDARGLPSLVLGDPDATQVGEFVMAIGNPGAEFGSELPNTVTTGIVSAKGRNLAIIRQFAGEGAAYAIEDFIQTDAVINPGNSGGPLVNYRGEVIGVNTAIQSVTGYYQGYGFAIPITLAQDVMEDLIEFGRVRRAALRVQITSPSRDDVRAYGLPGPTGAVIQDFNDDSPAEKAGMERGDVIIAVDGKPVQGVGQLQRTVASYEPGERAKIKVIRYGKEITFDVKLAEANVPQPEPAITEVTPRQGNRLIGIQVQDLTPELARQYRYEGYSNLTGALVTNTMRFGPAWNAELFPGFLIQSVNGNPITDVASFDASLGEINPGDLVRIEAVAPTRDGNLYHRIFNMAVPEE